MSRTRAALTALFLIPVLLVAGCSDDEPKPKFAPPSSEAPSSTESTDNSRRDQQAAFVGAYFQTISDALSTGDPAAFLAMSASSCANCNAIAKNLRDAYAEGGRVEGGSWQAATPNFERAAPLGDIWSVDVRTTRERWIGPDGELVKTVRASVQHFGVALEEAGSGWKVRELKVSS